MANASAKSGVNRLPFTKMVYRTGHSERDTSVAGLSGLTAFPSEASHVSSIASSRTSGRDYEGSALCAGGGTPSVSILHFHHRSLILNWPLVLWTRRKLTPQIEYGSPNANTIR